MKPPDSNLSVWVGDSIVWVKVEGRANFHCSVDFKALVNSMRERGYHCFRLDLSHCLLMDSTFLGVLAQIGQRLSAEEKNGTTSFVELLNPSNRIAELLENLGVTHLFKIPTDVTCSADQPYQVQPPCPVDKAELTRTSLDAHKCLMDANPANVPKFTEVAKFLEEDLKKLDEEKGKGPPAS